MIKEAKVEIYGVGGISCCCCRCCTCVHVEFLKTLPGILKLLEVIISFIVQSLLVNYGLRFHNQIGTAFEGALTTSSACFFNSAVLLFCYVISEKSYKLIRGSCFEILFSIIACIFCTSSASYLGFASRMFLLPLPTTFDVYPAMTIAYFLCGTLAVLYAVDAYVAFRNGKLYH